MSDLSNPLFDNQREFLERQKEEYKNALMGDVEQIKSQGQEVGKKVAIAGGVLVAGYLLRRMFSGGKKKSKKLKDKKAKKAEKDTTPLHTSHTTTLHANAGIADYNSLIHEQEDDYTLSSERMHHAQHQQQDSQSIGKSLIKSDVAQMITQQLVALLMIYLTKKVEEYLSKQSENSEIATQPIEVTEIETIEHVYPEKDAL